MKFHGAFQCEKCGHNFTVDLGPIWMAEKKTPKNIGEGIGQFAVIFARNCKDHEADCDGTRRV